MAELAWLADLQRTVYPHSGRLSAERRTGSVRRPETGTGVPPTQPTRGCPRWFHFHLTYPHSVSLPFPPISACNFHCVSTHLRRPI